MNTNEINTDLIDRSGAANFVANYGVITNPDGSLYFNGSSYLEITDSDDWYFGTGNFTIDCFVNFVTLPATSSVSSIITQGVDSTNHWTFRLNDATGLTFNHYPGGSADIQIGESSYDNWKTGKWYHIAIVRNSNTFNLYINGSLTVTGTNANDIHNFSGPLRIGATVLGTPNFNGYLKNIRISKGVDRTTEVSDPLYINTSNHDATMINLDMDENHYYKWSYGSGHNGGTYTPVIFDSTDSMKLDSGSSTGTNIAAEMEYDFGSVTADIFTLEFKVYHDKIGVMSSNDCFQLRLEKDDMRFNTKIGSDGIYIFNGSAFNHQTGSGTWVAQDVWQTWKFVIDTTTPESATCDIYLDNILKVSSVDCSDAGSFTDGMFTLTQYGDTNANNITYVDYIKVNCEGFAVPTATYTSDSYDSLIIQPEEYEDWRMIATSNGHHYGYTMGVYNGTQGSTIERILFSFDSGGFFNVGNLSQSKYASGFSGFNSSNYGFAPGGYVGVATTIIDRITFPFDSGTASNVGNISGPSRWALTSCNSSAHGFIMGGSTGTTRVSSIDRVTFPFDSGSTSVVGNLPVATELASSCNSSNYGFCMAGNIDAGITSNVNRITFPLDSGTASNVGNLSISGSYRVGCNSSTHGFCSGGSTSSYISTVNRITFPFDSGTGVIVGNCDTVRGNGAGINSTKNGYIIGGTPSSGILLSVIHRIFFPFNSGLINSIGNLSTSKSNLTGVDGTDFVTQFV